MNDDECGPPDDDVVAQTDQDMANAIREVVTKRYPAHAPYMVVNWQLTATIMDNEGERSFWALAPENAKSWEILGMLNYAVALENAQINRQTMEA